MDYFKKGLDIQTPYDFKFFSFDSLNIFTNSRIASNFLRHKAYSSDSSFGGQISLQYSYPFSFKFDYLPGKDYSWNTNNDFSGVKKLVDTRFISNQSVILIRDPEERFLSGISQVALGREVWEPLGDLYKDINTPCYEYIKNFIDADRKVLFSARKNDTQEEYQALLEEKINAGFFQEYFTWAIKHYSNEILSSFDNSPHHSSTVKLLGYLSATAPDILEKIKILDLSSEYSLNNLLSSFNISGSDKGMYSTSTSYLNRLVKKSIRSNLNHSASLLGYYLNRELEFYNYIKEVYSNKFL